MSNINKEEILAELGFPSPSIKSKGLSNNQTTSDEWPTVYIDWDAVHAQTHKPNDQSINQSDSDDSDNDLSDNHTNNQSIKAMNQWKQSLNQSQDDDEWVDPSSVKPTINQS